MKKKTPIKLWRSYYDHAGHFIGGSECKFHITTIVGDFYISTVGEYFPDGKTEPIGSYNFYYETMVFARMKKKICHCGCKIPIPDDFNEKSSRRYVTKEQAQLGHREVCFQQANIVNSVIYTKIFTDGTIEMPF